MKIKVIKPVDGSRFSPLYEDEPKENYVVTNAGNSSLYIGGTGINGAFYHVTGKLFKEELHKLNSQLNTLERGDGIAYPLKFSNEIAIKSKCLGMIYAVGPNRSGERLDNEESRKFLDKLEETGYQIGKSTESYKNLNKIKVPMVSGSIFRPQSLTLNVNGSNKIFEGINVSILIFYFLVLGIKEGFGNKELEIEFYYDPLFDYLDKLNTFLKSQQMVFEVSIES